MVRSLCGDDEASSVEFEASEGNKRACKDKPESQKEVWLNRDPREEKSSPASLSTKTGHGEGGQALHAGKSWVTDPGSWRAVPGHACTGTKAGMQRGEGESTSGDECTAGVRTA